MIKARKLNDSTWVDLAEELGSPSIAGKKLSSGLTAYKSRMKPGYTPTLKALVKASKALGGEGFIIEPTKALHLGAYPIVRINPESVKDLRKTLEITAKMRGMESGLDYPAISKMQEAGLSIQLTQINRIFTSKALRGGSTFYADLASWFGIRLVVCHFETEPNSLVFVNDIAGRKWVFSNKLASKVFLSQFRDSFKDWEESGFQTQKPKGINKADMLNAYSKCGFSPLDIKELP